MSKVPKSPSHSRSRSGSRSRSRSFSRSRTRSRSRSRSRKHRYSSRSRSRSRSHSPGQHRDRNYPREYQNNREFRGYHRGFRRPYYYRGRGRGYFPRGRYQRGGGYNNNYRPNNWQNYRQHPQQQAPHHQHSPRRGRSRSRTPKKRSGSPRSRSRSRYSDRSSSGRSRRSSSSSSRSSSPRRRSGSGSAKRNAKDVKDRSASKEAQQGAGGDEELEQEAGGGGRGEADEEGGASEKGASNWQGLTDYNSSPKKASPQVRSAVIVGQGPAGGSSQPSPSPKGSAASGNSATAWQSTGATPSSKSPVEKSPSTMITGFGFFSKEEHRAGEKAAISTAFKKFLEEHKNKKQACDWENGRDKDVSSDAEREKGGDKCGAVFERGPVYGSSKGLDHSSKGDKDKYKYGDRFEGDVASGAYMKGPLFLCANAEEDGEDVVEPRPKARKDREPEDEPRPKGKATLSAQELFEERFGKWDDVSYFPVSKERARKEAEPAPADELDSKEVELYRSRKERASALAKKEVYRGFSPEKPAKARKRERAESSPTPPPHVTSDTREREMFMVHKDNSPPRASGKRGAELSVRMDPLWDELASASGTLADERRISRDLVHPTKKEKEFRSIFQHIQATQQRRSPSELFAQHIVTIVHHIKAQHFPSSGMTLNERFAMYQRRAAEKEMMKPRKSPEIHRRIDISPSAFKKHSHLFEGMKSSGESSYKEDGKKSKSDSMDLRLDIERRKKQSSKERDHKRDAARGSGDSPGSSRERSSEKFTKYHKKSKKSKKKRERSRSSSSSSSSSPSRSHRPGEYPHEEAEPREEGFNKARLGPREYGGPMERGRPRGGFQFRIRGRGWGRGNYPGNHSNGNPPNMGMPQHPKNEDWDPEYTPKSRKYYLHDDREGEVEKKWVDTRGRGRGGFVRGRGRFIFRKATAGSSSPKWTHDKFQGSGEEGELRDEDSEQDHKEEDKAAGSVGEQ